MTRRLLRLLLVLVVAGATALTLASPASAVRHRGPNWTWEGPASWSASYSTYGITVSGGSGATLDLGFSSILCAGGATWDRSVNNYFAAYRRKLRGDGWRFTAGPIARPAGASVMHRRQTLTGTAAAGRVTGVLVLDYDFTTNVDGVNYCYQRSIARYANTPAWRRLRGTLAGVQSSLAYSGPGAPGEDPTA